MSWGDSLSNEGSDTHDAWYLIASVDFTGTFDFDRVTGGTGANGVGDGTLAAQSVPDVSVSGNCPSGPLTNGTANTVNAAFFDIPATISDTSPAFLTEAGLNPAGTTLISGLQIVYMQSASAPTSGDPGLWTPALDPADPTQNAAMVAWGGANSAVVSLPNAAGGDPFWLGARIVYADSSIGPNDPLPLTSWVGGSCGPVAEGGTGPIFSVTFDSVTALRVPGGVRVTWQTTYEDDVLGFNVYRTSDPNGTEADLVIGQTEAGHAGYSVDDLSASKGMDYYYVREITSSGQLGDRSPVVGITEIQDATGGRTRTSTLR